MAWSMLNPGCNPSQHEEVLMVSRSFRNLALLITSAAAVGAGLLACGSGEDSQPSAKGGNVAKSELARDTNPNVSEANLRTLTLDNATFGIDLLRSVRTGQSNVFLSPHSISSALVMTYAGAEGNTKAQMAQALRFTLPDSELHAAFNRLDLDLQARGNTGNEKSFRLNLANAIWALADYPWKQPFLDVLALNYGAGINLLPSFVGAEDTINAWVGDQTNQMIPTLLPPGTLTSETRMALVNAVYFRGSWADPFEMESTSDGVFQGVNGDVTVPMMRKRTNDRYLAGTGYQAIRLPYEGEGVAMTIVLSEQGREEEVRNALDPSLFNDIAQQNTAEVILTMPKFKFTWGTESLKDALTKAGMTDAFAGPANFTGMADTPEQLFIKDVLHQAVVAVDEDGTEAAGATTVIVDADAGAPPIVPPVEMKVDRPFFFGIHDATTGALLFLGEVVDPS